MIQWNMKCIIGGGLLVGLVYAASAGWIPRLDFSAEPLQTTLWLSLLFVMYYVVNTYLDLKFGCDHGDFYQRYLGW